MALSFIDTVKAIAAPIFFFPNRELTDLVMADASDNETNGTYHTDAVLGLESPIDTDPLSRAFSGPASLLIADAPLADVRDTFSWGFFIYKTLDEANDNYQAFTRAGQIGLGGGSYAGFNDGNMVAVLRIDGVDYQAQVNDTDLPRGAWYFVGVSRSGSVLKINVNGANKATNNLIDTGDMDPQGSPAWYFGSSANPLLWVSVGTCSPFLSPLFLSDADWLEIYESARSRLPMLVDISMRTTMIPDLTPPPVYAAFPYTHDFTTPAVERLIRLTEVIETDDGSEERNGQADKTRRRYTYEIPIMDTHSRRRLKALLRNNQKLPIVWPTATDATDLADPVSPGTSVVIPVDTQYMDYDIGGRAILGDELSNEVIEIIDMDGDGITAKSVQNEWPAGTPIVPAKRAVVQQNISLTSITDDTQDMTLTANILVEDIVALPNRITPYTPTTYRGVEVFDPFEFGLNDTSEAAEDDSYMVSQVLDTGAGIFRVDYDQTTAKEGIGYTFFLDSRELISRWLGWFEARAGRLNNLWVPTMTRDVGEIVDMTSDSPAPTIVIKESTYTEDYVLDPSRVDICLVQLDETIVYRHITATERGGVNEILTVSVGGLDGAIEDTTEYLCFLLMCRLDADEVELAWYTSDLVKATVKFREVPKEAV